jgi:PAS domain S-box-containing protein
MLSVRQMGLKGRAITFCVVLLLGTVSTLCAALMWRHYRSSIDEVVRHALTNARFIGLSAEPYILLNDVKSLGRVTQAAASNNSVEMARILDRSGTVLAQSQGGADFRPEADAQVSELIRAPLDRNTFRVVPAGARCLVVVPIWPVSAQLDLGLAEDDAKDTRDSGPVGFVCLVYSLSEVYAVLTSDVLSGITISVAVIGIGLAATILMIRQLLTPIGGLVQTATAIADGDLSNRASEDARGEVGVLACAFNNMADKVEDYADNLEKLVYERTLALEQSEARTRTILNTAADGIITIDEHGTVESFNAAAERVFGWSAGEVIGRNVTMLMPPSYAEPHDSFIAAYLRSGERKVIGSGREVQGRRKDGNVFPMDLAVSEVQIGERRMFTGIVRDITERKRAEEEQEKLVSLVENSSDLIMMCSLNGRVLYVNEAGRELMGMERVEEIVGSTLEHWVPPDEWMRLREVHLPGVLKHGAGEWQGHIRHAESGHVTEMQVSTFLIRHPQTGEPMCLGSIQRDITLQKQAERQLKKNMSELEQFNRLAVGRELRMIELKREVNGIARTAGLVEPYDLSFAEMARR